MTMRYAAALAVTAALVFSLAGCSGSGGEEPEAPPSAKPTGSGQESGPVEVKGGVVSPDSLSDFVCGPADDGTWSASGTISNADRKPEDYRVTIVVAPPGAGNGKAREITLAGVPGGDSKKFEADKLPIVFGEEPTCSVQVARLT